MPILRYDLGDSILERPDPCPCGNALTAIRVRGRAGEVLSFTTTSGREVPIPPLAFQLDVPGRELLQIVQATPTSLRMRFAAGADPESAWKSADADLKRLFAERRLDDVEMRCSPSRGAGERYAQGAGTPDVRL